MSIDSQSYILADTQGDCEVELAVNSGEKAGLMGIQLALNQLQNGIG
jgi:hypothetical protein